MQLCPFLNVVDFGKIRNEYRACFLRFRTATGQNLSHSNDRRLSVVSDSKSSIGVSGFAIVSQSPFTADIVQHLPLDQGQ